MLDKYDCDFEALADELGCSEKDIENELNSTY